MPDLSLNSAIHFSLICQATGREVTGAAPHTVACLLCRRGTMRIYGDMEYGSWWVCDHCGFRGPTLPLYQKAKSILDVRSAWLELIRETHSRESVASVLMGPSAIANYTQNEELRLTVNQFWTDCQNHLKESPANAAAILSHWNLWSTQEVGTLALLAGCCNKLMLEPVIGLLGDAGLKKNTHNIIVLRHESLPGKPSGFSFWSKDKQVFKALPSKDVDAGMLGLETTIDAKTTVYAICDPLLWLHLQKRYLRDKREFMPLVCYSDGAAPIHQSTTGSWNALFQPRIVLWSPDPIQALLYARRLGDRGFVATRPKLEADCEPRMLAINRSASNIMQAWDASAVPWLQFVQMSLLTYNPSDALTMLERIGGLSNEEKDKIRLMCTPEQWRRISLSFAADRNFRTFRYGTDVFLIRPGLGLFRINNVTGKKNQPAETLIANAFMELVNANYSDGETWLQGEIRFKEHTLSFKERETVIRSDPGKFISTRCTQAGVGYPSIHDSYRKHLLAMATADREPKVVQQVDVVGWNPQTSTYLFPKFVVKDGQVQFHEKSEIDAVNVPCDLLAPHDHHPQPSLLKSWLADVPAMHVRWAVLTTLLANLTAASSGHSPSGIVVLDRRDIGRDAVLYLAESLRLMKVTKPMNPGVWEIEELTRQEQRHGVPLLIQADSLSGVQWENWARKTPHNCILLANVEMATNLNLVENWLFVQAGDDMPSDISVEGMEILLPLYLQYISQRKWKALGDRPWPLPVLDGLLDMLFGETLPPEVLYMRHEIERRLLRWGFTQPWKKFMAAVFCEVLRGELKVESGQTAPLSREDDRILIHYSRLTKLMKRHNWYLPPAAILSTWLNDSDMDVKVFEGGWSVSVEAWTRLQLEWLAAFKVQAGI